MHSMTTLDLARPLNSKLQALLEPLVFSLPAILLSLYYVVSCRLFSFGWRTPVFPYVDAMHGYVVEFLSLFLTASLAGSLGFLVSSIAVPVRPPHSFESGRSLNSAISVSSWFCTVLALILISVIFLSVDGDGLVSRSSSSIEFVWPAGILLADLFFFPFLLAALFARSGVVSLTLVLTVAAAFSALGERQGPVALIVYGLARPLLVGGRGPAVLGAIVFVWGWFLMATVIALRPLGRGGFLEIWSLITAARFLEVEVFAYAVNYVSNFSTFVNAIGLAKSGVDREILAYSINPLPSALLEQPRYFEEVVKIRSYVPLPGLAQVLAQFRYGSCLLFFAFGVCAGGLRGLLSIVGAGMPGVYFWACVLIPLVFALQYNLRTASRLGYAVAFLGVVFIVLRFISGRRSALAAEVQR